MGDSVRRGKGIHKYAKTYNDAECTNSLVRTCKVAPGVARITRVRYERRIL